MRRIQLDNQEFEGSNNAYLLTGSGPTTLLDTGIATDATRANLTTALAEKDLTFPDIDRVLVTHWHEDHAGLVGAIQAASDCDVFVHPRDAPIVKHDDGAMKRMCARQQTLFDEWGVPPVKQRDFEAQIDATDDVMVPPIETTLTTDGTTILAGDRQLQAVHTPGHTAGHLSFLDEAANVVFSGDALLPVYTPNVGGADVRLDHPLANYLSTLDWFIERDPDQVFPGHRDPIGNPVGRAREILRHHADRSRRVLDVIRQVGPADAWTVSQHLFGTVEGVHIIHGPGEAYAHLDHLSAESVLVRTGDEYLAKPDAVERFVSVFGFTDADL